MWSNILDRISFISLSLVVVLLPVFFLPFSRIPVEISKGLILVLGLAVSVIFWAVARFSDGKISFPRSPILASGLLIVFISLLSSFFSSASEVSFFGVVLDMGTFWFMFAVFLLMLISSLVIKDSKSAQALFLGTVLSIVFVMVFQIFRFFLPEVLSLGVLGRNVDNLAGSFNSLGLLAGFSCLASLFVLEFFSVTKRAKYLLGSFILVSLFLVASVNFILVWELLGIFSLIIVVYKISFFSQTKKEDEKITFPAFAFTIVIVSLLFFMSGQFIGGFLPNRLGLSNTEISPSFSATMLIAKEALKKDPLLGIGPNRFGELWAMHKPISINDSAFWNVSFNSGSGVIPTLGITTGYLGILSWLVFFILFILTGIKSVFSNIRHKMHREITAFFVLALYLFTASFFYSTGPVILLLAFAFVGVFIGLLSGGEKGEFTVAFLDDHRKSFIFIFSLVLIMIFSAAIAFKYTERFASVSYFERVRASETIPVAESSIIRALSLNSNDLYMRTYTQVYLVKLNSLLNTDSTLSEEARADLQVSFDQALSGALTATRYNEKNYLNYQTLGDVYSTAGAIGVDNAYSKAVEAYEVAATLNPTNPGIELAISRAYLADGKTRDAKELANKALTLKKNYIDAFIVLSQIAKKEGNNISALSYAKDALSLSPSNEDLIQYVNSLKSGGSSEEN